MGSVHEEVVRGTIIKETDNALLFQLPDEETEVWLPYSEIYRIVRGDEWDHVTIPLWLAMKKGLCE